MPKAASQRSKPLEKPDHISISQIRVGRCLHRWKLTRLTNEVDTETPAMRAGSFVHSVIYLLTKHCVDNKCDPDAAFVDTLIDEEFERFKVDEMQYIGLREALLTFSEFGFDKNNVLDVEKHFRQDIGGKIIVEGIIDRVNYYVDHRGLSVLEVVDYKNQQNIESETEVRADPQLNVYRWIAQTYLYPGCDLVRMGKYFVRWNFVRWSGEPEPKLSFGKIDEAQERMIRRWALKLRNAKDYPCTRGEQCHEYGGCPVMLAGKCPAWTKTELRKMQSGSLEDRVRAARAMREENKRLVAGIKAELKQRDPIVVDGKPVGQRAIRSVCYRLLGWDEWARKNAVPLAGITITKTDVERAIKARKNDQKLGKFDEDGAEAFRQESASTRFEY